MKLSYSGQKKSPIMYDELRNAYASSMRAVTTSKILKVQCSKVPDTKKNDGAAQAVRI
jgi:hypothetical protein